MNQQVTDYIQTAEADQKQIMEVLRELIHSSVRNVKEEFKWSRPVFASTHDFAYLKTAKKYVTLGFFKFDNLNDPNHKLEGTGKDMRHIKIKTMKDIDREMLKEWFVASA
jgi:hypothetical protein